MAEVHFLIQIIPKGYRNLPVGQTSLCASKTSHFRKEMHHFPVRENITGSCENSFSQLPFLGALSCVYASIGYLKPQSFLRASMRSMTAMDSCRGMEVDSISPERIRDMASRIWYS